MLCRHRWRDGLLSSALCVCAEDTGCCFSFMGTRPAAMVAVRTLMPRLLLTPARLYPHPADEGCYAGGTFLFQFRVPDSYPSDPPRVRCLTQVSGWGSCGVVLVCRTGRVSSCGVSRAVY